MSADPGDDLVLIGDGVNAQEELSVAAFILNGDAENRRTMVASLHKFINTAGLADLTEKHGKIISWPT
jgi:sulfur transfer complex TusBCD TusB component (DsrH family)